MDDPLHRSKIDEIVAVRYLVARNIEKLEGVPKSIPRRCVSDASLLRCKCLSVRK